MDDAMSGTVNVGVARKVVVVEVEEVETFDVLWIWRIRAVADIAINAMTTITIMIVLALI
jgi:hypothetical protein